MRLIHTMGLERALFQGALLGLVLYCIEVLLYGRVFFAGILDWGQIVRAFAPLIALYVGAGAVLGLVGWAVVRGVPTLEARRDAALWTSACVAALLLVWIAPTRPLPFAVYLSFVIAATVFVKVVCVAAGHRRGRWSIVGVGMVSAGALVLVTMTEPRPELSQEMVAERRRGGRRPPNVVMIVLDTVRADHLSVYGYQRKTTPGLERLAGRATVYEHAISAAAWTVPAHASFFTGQLPSVHGAHQEHLALDRRLPTLAGLLAGSGYHTAAIVNNPFLSRALGFDRGFTEFHENWGELMASRTFLASGVRDRLFPGRVDMGARTTMAWVRRFLERCDDGGPFFLFINLMEAHQPYGTVPDGVRERFLRRPVARGDAYSLMALIPLILSGDRSPRPDETATMRDLYDGALVYLDETVQAVVDALDAHALLDETLLVVTSDHGENLGDHGLIDHFFTLANTVLRVPLIVRWPGQVEAARVHVPVQAHAVFSSILQSAGIGHEPVTAVPPLPRRDPPMPFTGPGIVSEQHRPWFIMQRLGLFGDRDGLAAKDHRMRAVQDARWKLVWKEDGSVTLYDLGRDPGEARDVADDHPAVVRRLLDTLGVTTPRKSAAARAAPPAFDWLTFRSLRALGYVE